MYQGARVLGIVPARGGSKGVPRKNIRSLAGEPLIGHSLRTARHVAEIDLLVVSTDDDEIASVSRSYDVRVIERPASLASDTAPTEAALLQVLDVLEGEGRSFDIVLVLEPTSPFRSVATIARAIELCARGPAPSVLAVRQTRENIGFIRDDCFRPVVTGAPRRRQERQAMYIESSTIYACRVDYLRRTGTLVAEDWGALVVPNIEAADINTEDDFKLVEFLMLNRRQVQNA
jgi:CMP-N,N'-diacetyllegionaminic acid synthase